MMKNQLFVLFQQQPLGKKRIARLTSCASFAFLLVATMTLQRKRCSVSFFIIFRERNALLLSCYFTKKRSSKIFKIEKINRQTPYKNGLIFTK